MGHMHVKDALTVAATRKVPHNEETHPISDVSRISNTRHRLHMWTILRPPLRALTGVYTHQNTTSRTELVLYTPQTNLRLCSCSRWGEVHSGCLNTSTTREQGLDDHRAMKERDARQRHHWPNSTPHTDDQWYPRIRRSTLRNLPPRQSRATDTFSN
ncbi:hypothetical protein PILCRDRAFT_814375 [Piloderma croceum F 1598]|uniref:Uncharacterized protein n=1 Tax=Piloderma croceum (strain F 1598) TaxID=765440 RepID=A0A0C3CFF4_PILCF|nr:hypothetical protein PILCRDRAFT_814375 [Piloderma croceum F 1598]